MSDDAAVRAGDAYLDLVDRLLPGRITGFYVVGSAALGAFHLGRSDLDFVAVVDGPLTEPELGQVRVAHRRSGVSTGLAAIRRGRSPLSGTCNGIYLDAADLTLPVSRIEPLVSHIGHELHIGARGLNSDISPVAWQVFAEHGLARRGPAPSSLGLDGEPHLLASWNRQNLDDYWRPWAERVAKTPHGSFVLRPRWSTAWGTLGAPRLHHTIATGRVISKEAAGEYAREVFGPAWHDIIDDALSYRRRERGARRLSIAHRATSTSAFVLHVIASAADLATEPSD